MHTQDGVSPPARLGRSLLGALVSAALLGAGVAAHPQAVAMTGNYALGKTFVAWSGACTGTAPQCTVTMTANLSTTAAFSK